MYKSRLNIALLFAPAVWFVFELLFLVKDNAYYKCDGIVGLIPIGLCLVGAYIQTKKLPGTMPIPHRAALSAVIFAVASIGRLISLPSVLSGFGTNSGILSSSQIVLDIFCVVCGVCAAACLVWMSVSLFHKKTPKVGLLAIPAALSFMLDLVSYFVRDPINSGNVVSQRIAVSISLVALFVVTMFYNAACGRDSLPKKLVFFALATLGYCFFGLVQALVLGAPILDVLPCLLYTFLTLTCINLLDCTENNDA